MISSFPFQVILLIFPLLIQQTIHLYILRQFVSVMQSRVKEIAVSLIVAIEVYRASQMNGEKNSFLLFIALKSYQSNRIERIIHILKFLSNNQAYSLLLNLMFDTKKRIAYIGMPLEIIILVCTNKLMADIIYYSMEEYFSFKRRI